MIDLGGAKSFVGEQTAARSGTVTRAPKNKPVFLVAGLTGNGIHSRGTAYGSFMAGKSKFELSVVPGGHPVVLSAGTMLKSRARIDLSDYPGDELRQAADRGESVRVGTMQLILADTCYRVQLVCLHGVVGFFPPGTPGAGVEEMGASEKCGGWLGFRAGVPEEGSGTGISRNSASGPTRSVFSTLITCGGIFLVVLLFLINETMLPAADFSLRTRMTVLRVFYPFSSPLTARYEKKVALGELRTLYLTPTPLRRTAACILILEYLHGLPNRSCCENKCFQLLKRKTESGFLQLQMPDFEWTFEHQRIFKTVIQRWEV